MIRTRFILLVSSLALAACVTKSDGGSGNKPSASASAASVQDKAGAPPPAQANAIPAPPDVAAPPDDAQKSPSGLVSKVIAPGTGTDHPNPEDTVKVNYTGWTKDGRMFDSSVTRGQPASFRLNGVIKGWTEGVGMMVVGEKRRLWIPAGMAYGEHPRMGTPAGDLTFDVELLEITPAPKPPPVPDDVKAAPANAKKTASGLAYRLLKPGTGQKNPGPTDVVTVNYTGWTPDGKMFDSSITRGQPASFPLNGVIKGWTEGVQLMKVGDKMRFWIPSSLAYGDVPVRPGAPAGPLVFDIELLGIKEGRGPGQMMPPGHP
jgi:FKBP-type peptidyl-prolyl cis-trans isomerase